jgi:hypothetical protein
MPRHGSSRWIAAQLGVSHETVNRSPERVIWTDARPVRFAKPGYAPTYVDSVERAYADGALTDTERDALLMAYMFGEARDADSE